MAAWLRALDAGIRVLVSWMLNQKFLLPGIAYKCSSPLLASGGKSRVDVINARPSAAVFQIDATVAC
jgi:hypothetical protein